MTDFKAKMHQIRFRLGLRPRPRWRSLQRSPRPPSWIWGPTSKEREREGGEGRRGEGRRGKGRGEEGRKGKGKERAISPPPLFGGSLRLWCPPPPNPGYATVTQFLQLLNLAIFTTLSLFQPPRSTRSSSVVTLSRPPTISSLKITDRSFRYASTCLWNQLPDSFRRPHHSSSSSSSSS